MSQVDLKELIVRELSVLGEATSEEILFVIESKGMAVNPMEFREALAELVREGRVHKVPSPEKRKFVFKLTNQH